MGRADRDPRLTALAESFRAYVERQGRVADLKAARVDRYENPIATVALRRDGTVESVQFTRSSGVPAIDDAIRRVVMELAPFAPFPPDVAMDYDVIEIRRVWTFDIALRLFPAGP